MLSVFSLSQKYPRKTYPYLFSPTSPFPSTLPHPVPPWRRAGAPCAASSRSLPSPSNLRRMPPSAWCGRRRSAPTPTVPTQRPPSLLGAPLLGTAPVRPAAPAPLYSCSPSAPLLGGLPCELQPRHPSARCLPLRPAASSPLCSAPSRARPAAPASLCSATCKSPRVRPAGALACSATPLLGTAQISSPASPATCDLDGSPASTDLLPQQQKV